MATSGVGITTPAGPPEYDVIINLYSQLVTGISQDPDVIVDHLLKYKIFSLQDQHHLRKDTTVNDDKARRILDIVKEKVESSPKLYQDFRKVIETQKWMESILLKLDGEYEKCTQNKQTEHIKTPINSVAEELTLHKGVYTHTSNMEVINQNIFMRE